MNMAKYMVLSVYHFALPYKSCSILEKAQKRNLCESVYHTCLRLGVKALWIRAMDFALHMVVIMPTELSADDFVEEVQRRATSSLMVFDPFLDALEWYGNYFIATRSFDCQQKAVDLLKSLPEDMPQDAIPTVSGMSERYSVSASCNHHIVIGVDRHLMRINLKFRDILDEAICDICNRNDCPAIIAFAMRDHVHILAKMRINLSVLRFADIIRKESQAWMRTNIHFRRVPDWSPAFAAYSVSNEMLDREAYIIEQQPKYHSNGRNYVTEIFHLSQYMGLPALDVDSIFYR